MNPAFDPTINGIFLLLAILLLLSSVLQFIYGTRKNHALAFLCLIASLWFFRRFFWKSWVDYRILYLVLASPKSIFIGPLVYFHVKMKRNIISTKMVLKHLFLPIIFYSVFLILVYGFYDFYKTISRDYTYLLTWYVLLSFIIYFSLSFKELKYRIKPFVIPKVYNTIWWFLVIFSFGYLLDYILSVISLGIIWYIPDHQFLRSIVNGTWIYYIDWLLNKPFTFIRDIFLIFYGFIEIPYFKTLFYPKDIMYDKRVIEGKTEIEKKLNNYFNEQKQFKNKELTISKCCEELGCSKKELSDYLKLHEKSTFTGYLNYFRVSEFKLLIRKEENSIYDINSIAEMAGFNSRATFYRVFKEIEGMTPTEYKNTLSF